MLIHVIGGKLKLYFTFELTGFPVGFKLKIWHGKYSALLLSKTEEKVEGKIMTISTIFPAILVPVYRVPFAIFTNNAFILIF